MSNSNGISVHGLGEPASGWIRMRVQAALGLLMLFVFPAQGQFTEFKLENPQVGYQTENLGITSAMDRDTLVLGAYDTDLPGRYSAGLVCVYRANGAGMWHLEAELTTTDIPTAEFLGGNVAISGETAVIGATERDEANQRYGVEYVFTRSNGVWTRQATLTGIDSMAGDGFGASAAISGDTVVVGATRSDASTSATETGAVYVFIGSGGTWTLQAKLAGSDVATGDQFGSSVAISGDTMVVGASRSDASTWSTDTGAAYVFTRSNGVWTQQGKLLASDAEANDRLGSTVALSGETAVVGAILDDDVRTNGGSIYVFTRLDGKWSQQQKLVASDSDIYFGLGHSLAISGDMIVGGAESYVNMVQNVGSAYVFTRSEGVWSQQQELNASDGAQSDDFGGSVVLSGDTAVIAAPYDDDGSENSGSAYVFTHSSGVWTEHQKLNASDAAGGDHFGSSVSVSDDTAVIGVNLDDDRGVDSGSAYIFTHTDGGWTQQGKLLASDASPGDFFGTSVSVSGDTTLVGAYVGDGRAYASGSTYVFVRLDGAWTQQAKLTAFDGASGDYFGWSVAVSGDTAVIGADQDDDGGTDAYYDSGSAYVFVRSGGVWTQQGKLHASDADQDDYFGYSVAIDGETALVGAPFDDEGGRDSGSAYVFTRSGGVWTEEAKLTDSDPRPGEKFGTAVAIDGDTAVVGAPEANSNDGAVYVFVGSDGAWTQQAKLTVRDAAGYEGFGCTVSVFGDTAAVGAYRDRVGEVSSGSAYVFMRTEGVWLQTVKLTPSDLGGGDHFGWSVGLSGSTVVVGANTKNDPETEAGAAYVFTGFPVRGWMLY